MMINVKHLPMPPVLPLPKVRLTPAQALYTLTSKNGLGVYASSDRLFKGAVFGRDSLEVAEDLMHIKPKLVEKILLTMASLQGEADDYLNEEEPGKIIHEYRKTVVDGKPLDKVSQDIFNSLARQWGGSDTVLAYYGSVDSTPHFIRALATYCQAYGLEILTRQVKLRSGQKQSVLEALDNAINWLAKHAKKSKSGLIEYQRRNPHGIENQVWKDSREFYVHKDGHLASHSRPISSIEVQSLTYDALILAAEILPSRKAQLTELADQLQKRVIELLWLPNRDYFALGTDFEAKNKLRVIKTITANPAEILDSLFLDNLPLKDKQRYITGIVQNIMGTDFLTDAGIRSRALSEAGVIKFWDYHGSYVSWPKETYDIAKGLRRQGFPALARELENRLLNVIKATRTYPEFIYVDFRGRVLGAPTSAKTHGELVLVDSKHQPEKIQAWTISAVLAINSFRRRRSVARVHQKLWQIKLEKEVLRHIPHVPKLRFARELQARYPAYPYELDLQDRI
ncbi:MAG: hypothetical protein WD877_02325 [Candidatus Saccharimonadales bacterium]